MYANDLTNETRRDTASERLASLARGRYLRVWREREQVSPDGRDFADYLGPPGPDETIPVAVTRDAERALAALRTVMADATMGGHRYGYITAGRQRVAEVTRQGRIRIGVA